MHPRGASTSGTCARASTPKIPANENLCRAWQRWLQWREANLGGDREEDKTAPEVALYLTFLAYKTGALSAVKTALTAMRYYAKMQGEEGRFMKDPLIETIVRGLERDFSKPIHQKEGFSGEEMRKIIGYYLREKIDPKLIDLRMACLLLLLYLSAGRFEEAAGIELENVKTLESGNLMIKLLKGKKNQLAKRQEVFLPKPKTGENKDMDITVVMKKYIEKMERQEGESKFLFPSLQSIQKGKEHSTFLLNKPITYDAARRSLLEAVRVTQIKGDFGLHSCRIGALTTAANSGKFSQLQLQNLGRWARMESAARYFLPREREQVKVGKELGSRLAKSLEGQLLDTNENRQAACNLEASRTKAAATAGEKRQEETARKRSRGLEKQEKVKKKIESKGKQRRLLLRVKRTGAGAEDYQALPPRQ